MMRQTGKQILTIVAWLCLAALARADGLVTTVVTDPLTGVAIEGYDPVSYFLGAEPQLGRPDFEYDWQGVPWHFASAANRDVFARNPDVYAPQYGGHCLTSLSRGYLSDGKPGLYVVEAMKLYFFYSAANRDAFTLSKTATLTAAAKAWPELSKQLSGPEAETQAASELAVASSSAAPSTDAPTAAASSQAPPSTDQVAPSVAPSGPVGNVQAN